MTRQRDAGFTLIESLVALVVLAVTSVALLMATEAHITRIGGLEMRAAAGWVTDNHLAELSLGLTPALTPPPMLGIAFQVSDQRTATADPSLVMVSLNATETDKDQPFGQLTGFLDVGGAAADSAP